ncbi:MAG: phosphoribosylglycinamide formyltransferase [Clostridia bacterium]|nr:phosphoribosylglycinamide formyltransferase [Clostridia bacterium]
MNERMTERRIKVAVLVSGGGTNLRALIDFERSGGMPSAEISLVVSDNAGAYALKRAEAAGIKTAVIPKKGLSAGEFCRLLSDCLDENGVELIVLAGFLTILDGEFTKKYEDRIINVHPSLIPSFCGKGFYGLKVHEAALSRGVRVTGATVHFVNEIPDGGRIIAQKAVAVLPDDTPETLQRRVMEQAEWIILPEAVETVAHSILGGGK